MKVTVLKNQKKDSNPIFRSIIILILGIVLIFHSEQLIRLIFNLLGLLVILFGVYQFLKASNLKGNKDALLRTAIFQIACGILILLLSNFLTNAISVVTGVWFFFLGGSKLQSAFSLQAVSKQQFIVELVGAIVFFFLGIYTIVSQNVLFVFLGILLVLYALFDILRFHKKK